MDASTLETSAWSFVVGVVFGLGAFFGCSSRTESPKDPAETVASQIETPLMEQYRGGLLRWRMWGEKAEILANGNVHVRSPKVLLYESGEPSLRVTAEIAEIVPSSRDFRLLGNVAGVSKHALLRTDELLWDDRDGTLTAPNAVEIRRGSSLLTGRHLTARPSMETFRMKQIRATLYPKDESVEPYQP